ncbi:hypothetical protein DPEC_G00353220 [Dallia pectoralis]|uniref:Uncharacterized protein n=1 Tax=Dallia pectoralis TaxID=75939 RepID=A0ACC2F2H2_DALPE|nr:hypothetical protein DPEC_G00353220 [Dallia pectoralis]
MLMASPSSPEARPRGLSSCTPLPRPFTGHQGARGLGGGRGGGQGWPEAEADESNRPPRPTLENRSCSSWKCCVSSGIQRTVRVRARPLSSLAGAHMLKGRTVAEQKALAQAQVTMRMCLLRRF